MEKQKMNGQTLFRQIMVIISALLCVGIFICSVLATDSTLISGALFLLFYALLLLGGYAIEGLFSTQNAYSFWAVCLGGGFAVVIAARMIAAPFGAAGVPINIAIVCLAALAGIARLWKNKKNGKWPTLRINLWMMVLIAGILVLSFGGITLRNLLPVNSGYLQMYVDLMWNTGNVASLRQGFPPADFHIANTTFYYHFFSQMFKGQISLFTQSSAFAALTGFSQFVSTPFLCLSTAALAQAFLKNDTKALFAPILFLFTLCASSLFIATGQTNVFFNNLVPHILYVPNGLDYAIPMAALSVLLYIQLLSSNRFRVGSHLLLAVFSGLTTGSKGPMGMILLGMAGGMIVVCLLKKQQLRQAIYLFISIALGFALVYFTLLRRGSEGVIGFSPLATIYRSYFGIAFWQPFTESIQGLFPAWLAPFIGILAACLGVLLFLLGHLVFAAIPFFLLLWQDIRHFRKSELSHFTLYGCAGGGFAACLLFGIEGSSQLYFAISAVLFVEIAALCWLSENLKRQKWPMKAWLSVSLAVSVVSASAYHLGWSLGEKGGYANWIQQRQSNHSVVAPAPETLTNQEYAAMVWLRDNTPDGTLMATNRHLISSPENMVYPPVPNDNSRYFYASAISERPFFLEGWAYTSRTQAMRDKILEMYETNEAFFNPHTENRVELLQQNKIEYLLVFRYISPDLELPELEKAFENNDIVIYMVPLLYG